MTNPARQIFDREILPLFEANRASWIERARITARFLARQNGSVTVDDVRAECPPPDDVDGRVMGGIFRASEFEKIGYVNSGRDTCHGRPIAQFRLRAA